MRNPGSAYSQLRPNSKRSQNCPPARDGGGRAGVGEDEDDDDEEEDGSRGAEEVKVVGVSRASGITARRL